MTSRAPVSARGPTTLAQRILAPKPGSQGATFLTTPHKVKTKS